MLTKRLLLSSDQVKDEPIRTTPWMTRGGVVIDTHAKEVTLAGINRSGSLTLMIPEGLHYAAAGDILAKLKGIGINAVRHTFIIEMVDQILARGHDVSLASAAIDALGEKDDKTVLADILAHNQQYGWTGTTRLQILNTVARLEAAAGIIMQ